MPQGTSATKRKIVKQLGMQRSGTNYLEKLLKINFGPRSVLVLNNQLGCKHHAITSDSMRSWVEEKGKLGFLLDEMWSINFTINVRSPLSWSLGFLKHRKRLGDKIKLKNPGPHVEQLNKVMPVLRNWRALAEKRPEAVCIIRFEDLVADYLPVMQELAGKLGLNPKGGEFHDVTQEVLSGGRVSKAQYGRRTYHVAEEWKKELTPAVRKAIVDTVDWELMSFFGYLPDYD